MICKKNGKKMKIIVGRNDEIPPFSEALYHNPQMGILLIIICVLYMILKYYGVI
jgi:hypothetical protein